jgi:anti-sigma factor RsiW
VSIEHIEVGAYALGLLNEQDTAAFEAHLATCPACTAELAGLFPMKQLLTGIGPIQAPPGTGDASPVTDLLSRRAAASRRARRRAVIIAAAACVAALGAGLGAGIGLSPNGQAGSKVASGPVFTGQPFAATDSRTGVTGIVGLTAKAWGTWVSLDLAHVPGPLECELIAVSKTGETRVVSGWLVPAPGDGVPGHPAHLLVQGGTSIPLKNLSRFDVVVVHGATLLSIPV